MHPPPRPSVFVVRDSSIDFSRSASSKPTTTVKCGISLILVPSIDVQWRIILRPLQSQVSTYAYIYTNIYADLRSYSPTYCTLNETCMPEKHGIMCDKLRKGIDNRESLSHAPPSRVPQYGLDQDSGGYFPPNRLRVPWEGGRRRRTSPLSLQGDLARRYFHYILGSAGSDFREHGQVSNGGRGDTGRGTS